jgi:hypothetical protein
VSQHVVIPPIPNKDNKVKPPASLIGRHKDEHFRTVVYVVLYFEALKIVILF